MPDPTSLGNILADEPAAAPEVPAAAEPDAPAGGEKQPVERAVSKRQEWRDREAVAKGMERDKTTGQFLPKKATEEPAAAAEEPAKPEAKAAPEKAPEAPAAPPKQDLTEKERAFLATAQEERRKRQELERRLAEMAAAKPKEPEKTFWDDPEAALRRQQEEVQKAVVGTKLQTSEVIARSRYKDFDEKMGTFAELAQENPVIVQQMLAAPDPADFAYRAAASHKMLKDAGGIEQLLEKARAEAAAETRAKLEAELKEREERLRKEREALPPTLSQARGTAVHKPVWGGPTGLDDILKGGA